MIGVVGEVRRSVQEIKNWFVNELIRQQKPELDQKIDEMLKAPKRIMVRFIEGSSIGARVSRLGKGLSIGKGLKMLRKLF